MPTQTAVQPYAQDGQSATVVVSVPAVVSESFARNIDPSKASGPRVHRSHGSPPRGLNGTPTSPSFEGAFGRLFRTLPAAKFGHADAESQANLLKLGAAMVGSADPAKDGPDPEESGVPAAYTYFGQFIDHDLTFDPASSLQKQNDPDGMVDYRTPRFDLDNLYGRGPDDQPYLYQGDGVHFQLGDRLTGASQNAGASDLVRSPFAPNRALIGDPRNDENTIISQFQGLWHRFHNAVVDTNPGVPFAQIQQEVRFHYQWILIHDFLPTLINAAVLDGVLPGASVGKPDVSRLNLRFFHPKRAPFMPVEFSVAAYRFGHSMIRPGYRLNDAVLKPIFGPGAGGDTDLRGFKPMVSTWAMDWRRFIDLEPLPYGTPEPPANPVNQLRVQFAYKIDTSLVDPLANLPHTVASDPPPSLASRNLMRAWRLGLPNGQRVARRMGFVPLRDDEIRLGQFTGKDADIKGVITDSNLGGAIFKDNCPLWTYVLAETVRQDLTIKTLDGPQAVFTQQLGPVGGTLVAETFLGILAGDSTSYLNVDPEWQPSVGVGGDGRFGLREMIGFAQGH